MILHSLYLENFRNIRKAEFQFHEKTNIFTGNNAQGKTNLCEAISLCLGKGFRGAPVSELVPFLSDGEQTTYIRLEFSTQSPVKRNVIEYSIKKGVQTLLFNGISMKSAFQLYGALKYVVFTPEHLYLIKGNPSLRRDYIDNVAFMQTRTHSKKVYQYNKALKQKNNLLTKMVVCGEQDNTLYHTQISVWNDVLAQEGINVTYGRLKYFQSLKVQARELYEQLSKEKTPLELSYESSVFGNEDIDFSDKEVLYRKYYSLLEGSFLQEVKNRHTVYGVHRDDLGFSLGGHSLKDFGSQGQVRSAALCLKLAEANVIQERNNEAPVLILDDVLSELDGVRRGFVLNHIQNTQVFITCCNLSDLSGLKEGYAWRVEQGVFTPIQI